MIHVNTHFFINEITHEYAALFLVGEFSHQELLTILEEKKSPLSV